jgi:hypothetical protein
MKRTRPRKWRNPYIDSLWKRALLRGWFRRHGVIDLDRLWREKLEGSPE